ncbi:MAG TPA: hypothetical protein VMB81_13530, partial [Candidatus Sulfotelmatobacter sp.]|nr:hypothetical protein [Candidatus Sulfotelmatobacter sp.]
IQAQFSLSYALARALTAGTLEPDAYAPDALADPMAQRLERLIELVVDPALADGVRGATLTVVTDRGSWRGRSADSADDPERPLDVAAIEAKFRRYAAPALGTRAAAVGDSILRAPLAARFAL